MRATVRDAAMRAYRHITRSTLKKTDDDRTFQEVDIDLHYDETKTKVERFQEYGFHAYVAKEDGPGLEDKAAEALVMYVNGNPAHAVIVKIGDRRYRFKKTKEGEVAVYDNLGQRVYLTRDRIVVHSPKEIVTSIGEGNDQDATKDLKSTSTIVQTKDTITMTAATINLIGDVHLGSEGGVLAAKLGTVDTGGYSDIAGLAKKVWVT